MGEASYGSDKRRPSKAKILIPGYRLCGCGGRGQTELPARGNPQAPVCYGRAGEGHGGMQGVQVKQARSCS